MKIGDYFFEWCQTPMSRRGVMLPHGDIMKIINNDLDSGYTSVYGFDKEDAKAIIESQRSKSFNQYDVFADKLYIDVDREIIDNAKIYTKDVICKRLDSLGLGYSVWFSGGKGYHIVIPMEPLYDKRLPYSQKKWVQDQNFECDFSIYKHSALISLPGRKHKKTGNLKNLVFQKEGTSLSIDLVEEEKPATNFESLQDRELLCFALHNLYGLCEYEPTEGNRHTALWSCSQSLADLGVSKETVVELLQHINSYWVNPKTDDELLKAVDGAFK